MKVSAILLAAGLGTRMRSPVAKQYMQLGGYPVLYYSLKALEESFVDEIILVTGKEEMDYCRTEIVEKYGFQKVSRFVEGGEERYLSVYNGLAAIQEEGYVFIHDGARPFLTQDILVRAYQAVQEKKACVVGVPVKDTIKIAGADQSVLATPERSRLWQVQTPQVFETSLIQHAYIKFVEDGNTYATDDAMILEQMESCPVYLVEGSYRNIKITTPEDMLIAEAFLASGQN
ncbi:2-C-methyl-D-erythritol 4-phosphate cytidylyltransferase [Anaerolentibacter hominis]|uniref:2-C-methyl-D-erythritol 4-phosphate cytidylyltransferase n=1 Tax=Anaerolentibacter hominis TaxID=3079009 RepID=UPI0031B862E2